MSSPNPAGDTPPAKKFRPRQVVSYKRTDPIVGEAEGLGVVLSAEDGEPVLIRPLSAETVHVPADDVTSVASGDVG